MTLEQVFSFLAHRLEGRDKVDNYLRNPSNPNESRWRTPNRNPRYVRMTTIEEDEEYEGNEEYEEQPRGRERDRRRWKEKHERRNLSHVGAENEKGKADPPKTREVRPPLHLCKVLEIAGKIPDTPPEKGDSLLGQGI